LNTSISLGRLGIDVHFIGEFGNDFAGNITKSFLEKNHVKTDFVYQFNDGQTTISLAFLQEDRNAVYNFYRNMPEKRLEINFPEIEENNIILYGSFYIFDKAIEEKIMPFLQLAKEKGAILIYDPNFRKPHYDRIGELKPKLLQYMEMADVIRGSNEDFLGIFGTDTFDDLLEIFPNKNALLIYTAAQEGINVLNNSQSMKFQVPKIKPLSTIGAGDTFNAGIIYGLIQNKVEKKGIKTIKDQSLEDIINRSADFAAQVCLSEDNYLSTEFCRKLKG